MLLGVQGVGAWVLVAWGLECRLQGWRLGLKGSGFRQCRGEYIIGGGVSSSSSSSRSSSRSSSIP